MVKTVLRNRPPRAKYEPKGKLGQYEYGLIASPNGWLDCVIIHEFGFINGVDNVNWPPYRDSKS